MSIGTFRLSPTMSFILMHVSTFMFIYPTQWFFRACTYVRGGFLHAHHSFFTSFFWKWLFPGIDQYWCTYVMIFYFALSNWLFNACTSIFLFARNNWLFYACTSISFHNAYTSGFFGFFSGIFSLVLHALFHSVRFFM